MSDHIYANYVAVEFFKKTVLESEYLSYQKLFEEVMTKLYPNDFVKIEPKGKIGDKKNDGYLRGHGVFFQVYAPKDIENTSTIINAIKKINNDFNGLLEYWNSIEVVKEYYFVVNDKFRGTNPDIEKKISELQSNYNNISIKVLWSDNFVEYFRQLSLDKKFEIVGSVQLKLNDIEIDIINVNHLTQVITHILDNLITDYDILDDKLLVPNLNEKIKVNNIVRFSNNLIQGANQYSIIDDYYRRNPEDKKILQEKVVSSYFVIEKEVLNNKLDTYLTNSLTKADCIMMELSKKMMPTNFDETNKFSKKNFYDAVYVILAYFFESCDIGKSTKEFKDGLF